MAFSLVVFASRFADATIRLVTDEILYDMIFCGLLASRVLGRGCVAGVGLKWKRGKAGNAGLSGPGTPKLS
jgi:hypothetical protein